VKEIDLVVFMGGGLCLVGWQREKNAEAAEF
jgi:hypothetical protein